MNNYKITHKKIINNTNSNQQKTNYMGVIAIAFIYFSFGIGWYVPGGISAELINAFSGNGVNSTNVDLSFTIYLIGLMLGAPLAAVVFYKMHRKYIMIFSAVFFTLSNIIIAFSIDWSEFLAFRFLSGLAHGALIAIGTIVVTALVPKNKRGLAISIVYSSLFSSTFTLVPLFTWWSNQSLHATNFLDQNWRWSFFITGCISFVALFFILFFIPKELHLNGNRNIKKEFRCLTYWPYMLDMLFCVCIFLSIFIIYPLLQEEWISSGYGIISNKHSLLAVLLLVYGICSFIGNQIGGFFADGRTFPTIYFVLFAIVLNIIALIISCIFVNPIGIVIFTLLFPILAYISLPNVYAIGLGLARHRSKSENADFESGVTAFMIGTGALIGTAIGGPITSSSTTGLYEPQNFIIIAYIVLGLICLCFLILLPIHWYMNSANLLFHESKIAKRILNKFPIIIDKYSTDQVIYNAYENKSKNSKFKLIDKRKKN